MNAVMQGALI